MYVSSRSKSREIAKNKLRISATLEKSRKISYREISERTLPTSSEARVTYASGRASDSDYNAPGYAHLDERDSAPSSSYETVASFSNRSAVFSRPEPVDTFTSQPEISQATLDRYRMLGDIRGCRVRGLPKVDVDSTDVCTRSVAAVSSSPSSASYSSSSASVSVPRRNDDVTRRMGALSTLAGFVKDSLFKVC